MSKFILLWVVVTVGACTGGTGPAGAPGDKGDTGDMGTMGTAGTTGTMGTMGTNGTNVIVQAEGAGSNCAAGGTKLSDGTDVEYACNGVQGAAGPSGVVTTISTQQLSTGTVPTTLTLFGGFAAVTVTLNQKILVATSAGLGSTTAGGGTGLDLYVCYQAIDAATPTAVGAGIFGLTIPQNQRSLFAMNVVTPALPANTYHVGLCGLAPLPNWNNNEFEYTTAQVLN